MAVTCELVVGMLAHLLVQDTACLPNAGEEQALAHEGCGEVCQAAKQGSPLDVHAPKRAGHERPHAAQVAEAPQKGTIALGGVVPAEMPLQTAEFSRYLAQRGPYSPGYRQALRAPARGAPAKRSSRRGGRAEGATSRALRVARRVDVHHLGLSEHSRFPGEAGGQVRHVAHVRALPGLRCPALGRHRRT